ncbi:MAG: PASTA domain-containing protein [Thermodesulfobacteriota bacterium]|nr:PASTA domain-containing protein [Thermodesulfobacteriota bacterium]
MIKGFFKWTGLFAGLMMIAGVSAYLTVTLLIKAEETVVVPDFSGRNVVYCLEVLTDLGLDIKVGGSEYSNRVPKNHVIYQSPAAGAEIKKGRDVRIIISKGAKEVYMPDLRGLPLPQARIIIEENDLAVGRISRTHDSETGTNSVMAHVPAKGMMVRREEPVSLLISRGRRPVAYVMPDLTGMMISEAILTLEESGFVPGSISTEIRKNVVKNAVVSHSPVAGERVVEGSRIDLVINRSSDNIDQRVYRSGGVRLFRYRVENGFLNKHIRITLKMAGCSTDIYDTYKKPGTSLWVLVPSGRDATVIVYENGRPVKTEVFSAW